MYTDNHTTNLGGNRTKRQFEEDRNLAPTLSLSLAVSLPKSIKLKVSDRPASFFHLHTISRMVALAAGGKVGIHRWSPSGAGRAWGFLDTLYDNRCLGLNDVDEEDEDSGVSRKTKYSIPEILWSELEVPDDNPNNADSSMCPETDTHEAHLSLLSRLSTCVFCRGPLFKPTTFLDGRSACWYCVRVDCCVAVVEALRKLRIS